MLATTPSGSQAMRSLRPPASSSTTSSAITAAVCYRKKSMRPRTAPISARACAIGLPISRVSVRASASTSAEQPSRKRANAASRSPERRRRPRRLRGAGAPRRVGDAGGRIGRQLGNRNAGRGIGHAQHVRSVLRLPLTHERPASARVAGAGRTEHRYSAAARAVRTRHGYSLATARQCRNDGSAAVSLQRQTQQRAGKGVRDGKASRVFRSDIAVGAGLFLKPAPVQRVADG